MKLGFSKRFYFPHSHALISAHPLFPKDLISGLWLEDNYLRSESYLYKQKLKDRLVQAKFK